MSWLNFILASPFVAAGFVWAWIVDMFERGQSLYGIYFE
jgi:hypothetical protein